MRVTRIDALKALVLLATMTGAGCVASWGVGGPPARVESPQGHLAAGGKGVAPRIVPSSAQTEPDDDCAAAQGVAPDSTRYVYQGVGQPLREDTSATTNLAGPAPGPVYAGSGAPPPRAPAPAQAAKSKPGC